MINQCPASTRAGVVKIDNDNSVVDNNIIEEEAYNMIEKGMLSLQEKRNLKKPGYLCLAR